MNPAVLIAGAGPVGLAMAAELARYRVPIRIVDKAAQRTDKSKALVVWSRTLELFDRMGCTPSFLAKGMPVKTASIFSGDEQIVRLDLSAVPTPHPYALMIPQCDTEQLLEEHLNGLRVAVERNVEVSEFAENASGVSSKLLHADGRQETLETPWLIGCDGAHSTIRHQLGMQFAGETLPSNWILADLQLAGLRGPDEIKVIWHAAGILAIFPIGPGHYRVVANVADTPGGSARPDPTLDDVQALLQSRGLGYITASSPRWLAAFQINDRKIASYRAGRVFLAGDAAHIHSPAGGQGMNTGIQDACNLAWKLALVHRGICAEEPLLDSYSSERSAIGDQVLKATGRVTAAAVLHGAVKQHIRNYLASVVFGLTPIRQMVASALSEVSIGYDDSPLNSKHAHFNSGPAPGERAPIRPEEPKVGAGDTPRFALFAQPGHDIVERLLNRFPDLLEPAVRRPFDEIGIWLVRPDGYVALVSKRHDVSSVASYLDKLAGARQANAAGQF